MRIKEKTELILNKLKEISKFEYVDMYYSQDENKMSIPGFPACLLGITGVAWDKAAQNLFKRKIDYGILIFNNSLNSNREKELDVINILDDIYMKFLEIDNITVKQASCIERLSNLSVYLVELTIDSEFIGSV